jgi:hypothetical protein
MSAFPPAFFEQPQSFEMVTDEELGVHVHGEGCGHEPHQHGDHVCYEHEGRAHFFKDGHWFRHHKTAEEAQGETQAAHE